MKYILLTILFLTTSLAKSQCVGTCECDVFGSKLELSPSPSNVVFTFDSFSKYLGGITMASAIDMKVTVVDIVDTYPMVDCKWKLHMKFRNLGIGGDITVPLNNEWKSVNVYGVGGSGINPTIDVLRVKVSNICKTPTENNYHIGFDDTGDIESIIEDNSYNSNAPVNCANGSNVNAPGNYINNYTMYNFRVDLRIDLLHDPITGNKVNPFRFNPGIWNLELSFTLEDDSP